MLVKINATGNAATTVHGVVDDARHLKDFELLRNQIHDRSVGVALGYQTGFFLTGRGGTGKTFAVQETIDSLGVPAVFRNARMTPMGLFSLLEEFPDHTIVLDDVAELLKKVEALQILLAALDGQPGQSRPVSYVRNKEQRTVHFSGGLIVISNLCLAHDPVINAIKSRITSLEFEPTDEQIAAFMRQLAGRGFIDVTPAKCLEVVEFIISESKNCNHRLDLRHLNKGLQVYRQCRDGMAITPWQDLIRSSLHHRILPSDSSFTEAQLREQRRIAVDLMNKHPHRKDKQMRDRAWTAATGKSADTFYRRVREIRKAKTAR